MLIHMHMTHMHMLTHIHMCQIYTLEMLFPTYLRPSLKKLVNLFRFKLLYNMHIRDGNTSRSRQR